MTSVILSATEVEMIYCTCCFWHKNILLGVFFSDANEAIFFLLFSGEALRRTYMLLVILICIHYLGWVNIFVNCIYVQDETIQIILDK